MTSFLSEGKRRTASANVEIAQAANNKPTKYRKKAGSKWERIITQKLIKMTRLIPPLTASAIGKRTRKVSNLRSPKNIIAPRPDTRTAASIKINQFSPSTHKDWLNMDLRTSRRYGPVYHCACATERLLLVSRLANLD